MPIRVFVRLLVVLLAPVVLVGCACATRPHLGRDADLASVRALQHALERAPDRVRELTDAPLRVLAVKKRYEGEPGGTARVVIVATDRGDQLGKISYVRTVSSRVVPWILQDEASRAGIAPALHKIIEGPALAELFRSHAELRQLVSPWSHSPASPPISMVLMDIVHDGFSFLQWHRSRRALDRYPASRLPLWTARLEAVERYMNRHNVQMADEQFLIQPDGGLMVIDFDHYTFVDAQGRRWAYKGITDYPDVDYWRTPSPDTKLNDVLPIIRKLNALYTSPPP